MSAVGHLLEVLRNGLDEAEYVVFDTFNNQPILPADKLGVMPYRTSVVPAPEVTQYARRHTFTIHLISPKQDPAAAIPGADAALDELLVLLDGRKDLVAWSEAVWSRFNDNLWCWTITCTITFEARPAVPAESE